MSLLSRIPHACPTENCEFVVIFVIGNSSIVIFFSLFSLFLCLVSSSMTYLSSSFYSPSSSSFPYSSSSINPNVMERLNCLINFCIFGCSESLSWAAASTIAVQTSLNWMCMLPLRPTSATVSFVERRVLVDSLVDSELMHIVYYGEIFRIII